MSYNFLEIEKKWQNYWLENKVFKYSIPKPNLLSNDPVLMYSCV